MSAATDYTKNVRVRRTLSAAATQTQRAAHGAPPSVRTEPSVHRFMLLVRVMRVSINTPAIRKAATSELQRPMAQTTARLKQHRLPTALQP